MNSTLFFSVEALQFNRFVVAKINIDMTRTQSRLSIARNRIIIVSNFEPISGRCFSSPTKTRVSLQRSGYANSSRVVIESIVGCFRKFGIALAKMESLNRNHCNGLFNRRNFCTLVETRTLTEWIQCEQVLLGPYGHMGTSASRTRNHPHLEGTGQGVSWRWNHRVKF